LFQENQRKCLKSFTLKRNFQKKLTKLNLNFLFSQDQTHLRSGGSEAADGQAARRPVVRRAGACAQHAADQRGAPGGRERVPPRLVAPVKLCPTLMNPENLTSTDSNANIKNMRGFCSVQ